MDSQKTKSRKSHLSNEDESKGDVVKSVITAITNARIFDGEQVIDNQNVVIDGDHIVAISDSIPNEANIIDAQGGTIIPGLIDSHVHTDIEGLRYALLFGVTTELDMMGYWSEEQRKEVNDRDDVADVRCAGMGLTPPGGHPMEYVPPEDDGVDMSGFTFPFVSTPTEASELISKLVAEGSDYIKIFMEDGSIIGSPGLPVLNNETLLAAVEEAHCYGKLAYSSCIYSRSNSASYRSWSRWIRSYIFRLRQHSPTC